MEDIANSVTWRDLLLIDLAAVAVLVVTGVIKGGPLLSDTAGGAAARFRGHSACLRAHPAPLEVAGQAVIA